MESNIEIGKYWYSDSYFGKGGPISTARLRELVGKRIAQLDDVVWEKTADSWEFARVGQAIQTEKGGSKLCG